MELDKLHLEDEQTHLAYGTDLEAIVAGPGGRIGAFLVDLFYLRLFLLPSGVSFLGIYDFIREYLSEVTEENPLNILHLGESIASLLQKNVIYTFIVLFIYFILIPYFTKGKTFGMKSAGLRIISESGNYIGFVQLILRNGIYLILGLMLFAPSLISAVLLFLYLIYWFIEGIYFLAQGYALHDMYGLSIVVNDEAHMNYLYQVYLEELLQEEEEKRRIKEAQLN